MDATQGLAAILRDARKGALLRMRSEIYSERANQYSETSVMESKSCGALDTPLEPVIGPAFCADPLARNDDQVCGCLIIGSASTLPSAHD